MDALFICLIVVGLVWAWNQHCKNLSEDRKYTQILGLRKPSKYDGFERKACDQFRTECKKHSIDVDSINMPNLCTYLRILERKGMHLEFVKDGLVRYDVSPEEKLIGTEIWQKRWSRIIFSPNVDAEDFCDCILFILVAHKLNESKIKCMGDKDSFGYIKSKDSFYIYRALHIMHYHILIRENDPGLKNYEISQYKQLMEITECPDDNINKLMRLENLADIIEGYNIGESNIRTEGDYPSIIYSDNILSGTSDLKCTGRGAHVDDGCIVIGTEPPFNMGIWNEEAVIAENVIGIEVNTHIINCEYLYLFLKLMFHKLNVNGVDKIRVKHLKKENIAVVPYHIQREIIRKGMPVKDDAKKLEAVFSSYNEAYPLLRLYSK